MNQSLWWSRRLSVGLLCTLILGLSAGCLEHPDRGEPTGPVAVPADDFDVDWLVPVPVAPGDRVLADDPAVVALDDDGLGWEAGQSSFVSADGQWPTYYGGAWGRAWGPDGGPASESPNAEGEGRSVEQGDVYASLDADTLLNLNLYRGLQVIDVADLEHPRVVSRVPMAGVPVEVYVLEHTAVVLVNGWQPFGAPTDRVWDAPAQGGAVVVVDLSDRLAPRVRSRRPVAGTIAQSRLTRVQGEQALFVVTSRMDEDYTWETQLESFSLTAGGELIEQEALSVEGGLSVIQATPEAVLLARPDASGQQSRVLVVDITDAKGVMEALADVTLSGHVSNHTNLDFRGGILRAASTGWTETGSANHLETFAVGGVDEVTPVDHVTFAPGETLYGTLFLEESAFAVTYLRVDPLHAFELDAQGHITERSEFIVSGWNDHFRPVLDQTRMIGVGVDDANDWQVALSLYDITDLESEAPLIERRSVPLSGAGTTIQQDHRAFSVLEDAVAVSVPEGLVETGLALLPVQGYDSATGSGFQGTQIFTFSAESLTERGFVSSLGPVTRGFAMDRAAASLSRHELVVFDPTDPDEPAVLGRAALTPNYVDLEDLGDYWARIEDRSDYVAWGYPSEPQSSEVQIVPRSGDPDLTEPVATIEIPAGAQVVRVGQSLVTLGGGHVAAPDGSYRYETEIGVVDLTDPAVPRRAGSLTTDRIEPFYGYAESSGSYGGYYGEYGFDDSCYGESPSGGEWGYGCGFTSRAEAYAVGERAAVFVRHVPQNRLLGRERSCVRYSTAGSHCEPGSDCTVVTGEVQCRSLNGGPERCTNSMQRCRVLADGTWECQGVPDAEIDDLETDEYCSDYDTYRYWESFEIDVLDVSHPDRPILRPRLAMPADEEDTGLMVSGSDLLVIFKLPVEVAGDERPFVRYFIRRIGLADPGAPELSAPVNVPGEAIRVEGDVLFTRDLAWGEELIEPAVNRLELVDGRAFLRARHVFRGEEAYRVALDGDGRLLVAHRQAHPLAVRQPGFDFALWRPTLSVLDTGDLSVTFGVELDTWMTFHSAHRGRALVVVPGGLVVLDVEAPGAPTARAFLPSPGAPRHPFVADRTMTFAAGLYGILQLDLNALNLAGW